MASPRMTADERVPRRHPDMWLDCVHDRALRRPPIPRRLILAKAFFMMLRDILNRRGMAISRTTWSVSGGTDS